VCVGVYELVIHHIHKADVTTVTLPSDHMLWGIQK
jgi:hypothetical protein